MVVAFDDKEKNAKLSLRQTEILAKLNSIVDGISAETPEKWFLWFCDSRHRLMAL